MQTKKTILITGAAGFIGSFLARALIWQGHTVIGVDNFNDYYLKKCKDFNLDLIHLAANQEPKTFQKTELVTIYDKLFSHFQSYYQTNKDQKSNHQTNNSQKDATSGKFNFYHADITDLNSLNEIFKNSTKIDSIIHLAAMAGVPASTKNPILYSKVNVTGTTNLLELAKKYKTDKFLFASSSSVYGHQGKKQVTESDDITHPESVYGATKVAGELICHAFHKTSNLKIATIRIFGPIYGPLQRPFGMLHQRAINYLHNNKTLEIYGRYGLETAKDATYIEDEVNGILLILNSEFNFEAYNIGTANPLPIKTWLDCIQNSFEKKLNVKIIPADKADVTSSADITKAKNNLNYQTKISMQEGINRQVEVFKLMPIWYQKMQNV